MPRRLAPPVEECAPVLQLISGVPATLELVAGGNRHRVDRNCRKDWVAHTGEAARFGACRKVPCVAQVCHLAHLS